MSERKIRWMARITLCVIPIALLFGLSQIGMHWGSGKHNNTMFPLGHVHNVAEAIGQVIFWPAMLVLFFAIVPWLVSMLCIAAFGNHRNLYSWRVWWRNHQ